ncbi:MSMEG_0567/Sll0786 family nitrogen starvation N-acetyltransferase [Variovorax sp. JS1663]|uniref:MSMEG_0567/Sll0786 family nitrogen starvation N-acetyltransferase n=1 Tax=Variovorax sp. JS1663 TaxID=1851577 RepID=UPI000B343196|nr:MSMEG_0567/Sll0786 family nitrogen starvation N-acetyltransferase [Variovorax sp. JS1663]OUM03621.1 histone acetyltransferase [Variovorax sp. JS1663]
MNVLLDAAAWSVPPAAATRPSTSAFRIQWASIPWMQREALALRRQVFCEEQRLFDRDDRDAIDAQAGTRLLVACSTLAGLPDEVVGTVRIHEAEPGLWWGSRLAVAAPWRRHAALGTGLIRLAVSSAHARGCREFLAHVQVQNVPLFERLHWRQEATVMLQGAPHAQMRADLRHYPPCRNPEGGFVLSGGPSS